MSWDHEHIFNHRTGATRGLVANVLDNGLVQTADVQTHDGVTRAEVEVHQFFGFAANPPAQGSVMVLVANGGDPSDMIGLPASCPAARFGGLAPGEVALYGVDGTHVHISADGTVTVLAGTAVDIQAPACTLTCSSGITLVGDVSIRGILAVDGPMTTTGSIAAAGDIDAGGNINAAGHISGH